MNKEVQAYNKSCPKQYKLICNLLSKQINDSLPKAKNKIWHGSPVWFIDDNPVVGYCALKDCVQLLFWSGQSFNEPGMQTEGSFKAAQARYINIDKINLVDLKRWLKKSQDIQWDYKNIVKRKGKLARLK